MSFSIIFSNTVSLSPTFGRGVEGRLFMFSISFFFLIFLSSFLSECGARHAKVRSLLAILVIKKKRGDPALKVTDHGRGQLAK